MPSQFMLQVSLTIRRDSEVFHRVFEVMIEELSRNGCAGREVSYAFIREVEQDSVVDFLSVA
jgi:hypothetical protein